MCIESLIEMENYDELKDYVRSISGNLSTELDYIKTNNVIIDAILNSKYKETLDKGIVFIFKSMIYQELKCVMRILLLYYRIF